MLQTNYTIVKNGYKSIRGGNEMLITSSAQYLRTMWTYLI